ncbi:MAG: ABC transporter permease, partial [Lachnospiraceae bacterium]|nr:ABC transporter permease [Lachnospiraceae bacterium]
MKIIGGRILKRIINFVLVIWGVVTLSFCLQIFTGTDPAEMIVRKNYLFATEEQIQAVRVELGLDAPFGERYFDYIKGIL